MKNLSISSSDHDFPGDLDGAAKATSRWITSLLLALLATVIVLTAYEASLRAAGAVPNFRDNQARWSAERDALGRDSSSSSIALLGASRIRAAMSINTLEQRYPGQNIYSLGFPGRNPCAVFFDLAEKTDFQGVVLLSMNENWVDCQPGPLQMHNMVARYHQEWNWARELDNWMSGQITQNLMFTDQHYSIRRLIAMGLETGNLIPEPSYSITHKNRQLEFDFSRFTQDELARMQSLGRHTYNGRVAIGNAKDSETWQAGVSNLSAAVDKIRARGGRVVLVRLPTDGPLKLAEHTHFPREQYWDNLSLRVPADMIIHYADHLALSGYELPDGNHIDYRDAPTFTKALFDIIEGKGVALNQ